MPVLYLRIHICVYCAGMQEAALGNAKATMIFGWWIWFERMERLEKPTSMSSLQVQHQTLARLWSGCWTNSIACSAQDKPKGQTFHTKIRYWTMMCWSGNVRVHLQFAWLLLYLLLWDWSKHSIGLDPILSALPDWLFAGNPWQNKNGPAIGDHWGNRLDRIFARFGGCILFCFRTTAKSKANFTMFYL